MAAPHKSGMSLYADLINPNKDQAQPDNGGVTISGAPVKYDLKKTSADAEAAARKKDGTVL